MIYDKTDMRYKYQNDSKFKNLVDSMEAFIQHGDFTPSEVREASMLASIHYEMMTPRRMYIPTPSIERELDRFHSFMEKELSQQSESRGMNNEI